MDISLVTIAFNGYGRFLGQFLAFASNMNPKPKQVIVVLGKEHGLKDIELMYGIYPNVEIVQYKRKASFGKLRNIGVAHTKTEWVQFVSVDDKIEPDAIRTFKRALKEGDADYICAKWYTIGLGDPLKPHHSPLPIEMANHVANGRRGGFVIPHSPFKRHLWEKHKYANTDLPNYDFLLHCVLNGARFIKADKPTTTYLRRPDSHARTKLLTIKSKANREKAKMQDGLVEYYKDDLKRIVAI